MVREELENRCKLFAISIIKLARSLPNSTEALIISRQLIRSATSIISNYRASRRAKSLKEFYAKICIVVEEADEVVLWLELLRDSGTTSSSCLPDLDLEANEFLRIFSATKSTLRKRFNT